jgi:hypothetical protein
MKVDEVVRIYRNCGFSVNKIGGYYFLDRGWINYSFPQLINTPIKGNLINSLKWKYLLTIIKTESRIKNTYEFVLETNDYGIDKFAPKKRNDIRKSLKDCVFKRPSLEDLFHFGLSMNQQTLARQGRGDKYLTDDRYWRKYITSFYSQENIFILGAFIEDRMVGYITVCKIAGNYYIIDPFYDKQASASSPIHGLIFTLVNQLIEKNGSIKIFYGIDSFNPLPNLNKYKQSMLFKRVPATRVYVINPVLLPFLKLIIFFCISIFKQKNIKNSLVQKMVRLLQGNRILCKTNR